jgi:hypothetical protein
MCTVLLPPGDNPIAVNKYIISYVNMKLWWNSIWQGENRSAAPFTTNLTCIALRYNPNLTTRRRRPATVSWSQYCQIIVHLLRNVGNTEHQSQGAWRLCDCGQSTIPSVDTCIWTVAVRGIITLLQREQAFMMFVEKAVQLKLCLLASHFLCPWSDVCSSSKLSLCIGCLLQALFV